MDSVVVCEQRIRGANARMKSLADDVGAVKLERKRTLYALYPGRAHEVAVVGLPR